MADMAEWIILNKYNVADLMHYLDDFITAGPADCDQCDPEFTDLASHLPLSWPSPPSLQMHWSV